MAVGSLIRLKYLSGLEEGAAVTERTSGVTEAAIKDEHGEHGVWCGGHYAPTCSRCKPFMTPSWLRPWSYCHGDCKWSRAEGCVPKYKKGIANLCWHVSRRCELWAAPGGQLQGVPLGGGRRLV